MKYHFLTNLIKLMATSEERGVRLNFYHQYEGAYTVLFLTEAITTEEFQLYAEIGRFIVAELFE